MYRVDDQAVLSRPGGNAEWLSSFVTPDNPDVRLLYDKLTAGAGSRDDAIVRCWQHVANIPYVENVRSRLTVEGRSYEQTDTWLYPSEIIRLAPKANCANKSFLLTSLLRNLLPASQVHCVLGHIALDGIGAHAWVQISDGGEPYILEATTPKLEKALVPARLADAYDVIMRFNDAAVEAVTPQGPNVLAERFGFCAQPFLSEYLCRRCQEITR